MLADAPADLTIQLDGSVEESIYDLFRMAPWSEVIESFAFEDEQSNHLLIADRSVTLIDIRIASTEALYVDSIGGVEDVPPQLDFHSDQDDREATGTLFPVWFGTNRKLVEIDGETYVSPREIEAETLHTGCCTVHIPKTHRRGETVSPWYRPERFLQNDALEIQSVELFDNLCDRIRREIEANGNHNHLLFIHGFNNSFPDAILRAAQIGFDLGIDGATIAFSWPSRKLVPFVSRYAGDGEVISSCRRAIEAMFSELGGLSGRLHVIAHSMGNRGLLAAWRNAFVQLQDNDNLQLGQVIFAAPDVFQAVFRDEALGIEQFCQRATLYASRRDKALGLARWLSQTPRAGLLPPALNLDGIETIDTPFHGDLLGHTYFAKAIPVLEDIATMIEQNLAPQDRESLKWVGEDGGYWTFDLSDTDFDQ